MGRRRADEAEGTDVTGAPDGDIQDESSDSEDPGNKIGRIVKKTGFFLKKEIQKSSNPGE